MKPTHNKFQEKNKINILQVSKSKNQHTTSFMKKKSIHNKFHEEALKNSTGF